MKVHVALEGDPALAAASAQEAVSIGADGAFTFEGQYDVMLPLLVAAQETDLELMTNVAIAGPRSPLHLACLDLEGVLVPEIWIAFAERTGIAELRATTRDIPDYNVLMRQRLALLDQHGLKIG